jgi:sugar O-acyltransferase (sialic acid O-acetyltransferase NeuD family)
MLIVGAKGLAKEVLQTLHDTGELNNLSFYDDVNQDIGTHLFDQFPILKSKKEAQNYFKTIDNRFTIGIGNPKLREKLCLDFIAIGGVFTTTISKSAIIGSYGNVIEDGCNLMANVVITNDVFIRRGCIINQISSIGHDTILGSFSEICPNVSISGNCTLGAGVFVGTGAIILPGVTVGNGVVIGAGAVVSKDLPDYCVAVGVPAKIIKQN